MPTFVLTLLALAITLFILKWLLKRRRRKNAIGIFHLYCSSGGGGERVLWHMVKALFDSHPNHTIYIYTHRNVHEDSLKILLKARELFKIDLISDPRILDRLEFIPLSWAPIIEAKRYPFLTLFFQNFMSIILAIQAAYYLIPEIYMETIGFTYTLSVFKLFGSYVITYVHYPTISSDMIQNVSTSSHASFNNRGIFVRSPVLRNAKLIYYKILVLFYGLAGRCADLVMVNSSWTRGHIEALWGSKVNVVYPPCDIESFKVLAKHPKASSSSLKIISIAQFRPEKNHQLQIEAFDSFINESEAHDSQLILFGGCRDQEDHKRVEYLRDLIDRLDLSSKINIVVNAPFEKLLEGMSDADVAIHTMENEHFGIVLVEFMAAGLITVAHNSGGPKTDIIDDNKNGFLANDLDDFSKKLIKISKMKPNERTTIRESAMKKSENFVAQVFEDKFIKLVEPYLSETKLK